MLIECTNRGRRSIGKAETECDVGPTVTPDLHEVARDAVRPCDPEEVLHPLRCRLAYSAELRGTHRELHGPMPVDELHALLHQLVIRAEE